MAQLKYRPSGLLKRAVTPSFSICLSMFVFIGGTNAAASQSPASEVAPPNSATLETAKLTAILKQQNQKSTSQVTRISVTGPIVTVMAQPPSQTTSDKELKIDAVFLAKTLIEAAPGQIIQVDVIFSNAADSKVISIDKKDIQNYSEGKTTPDEFLQSLHLLPVNQEEPLSVEPGPMKERRLLISDRIERLRKIGTGVKPFQDIFQSIESAIKSGDTDKLSTKLDDLEYKLTEQEEQVEIAKRAARGVRPEPKLESDRRITSYRARLSELTNGRPKWLDNNSNLRELKSRIDARLDKGQNNDALPLIDKFMRASGGDDSGNSKNFKSSNISANSENSFPAWKNGNRRIPEWKKQNSGNPQGNVGNSNNDAFFKPGFKGRMGNNRGAW